MYCKNTLRKSSQHFQTLQNYENCLTSPLRKRCIAWRWRSSKARTCNKNWRPCKREKKETKPLKNTPYVTYFQMADWCRILGLELGTRIPIGRHRTQGLYSVERWNQTLEAFQPAELSHRTLAECPGMPTIRNWVWCLHFFDRKEIIIHVVMAIQWSCDKIVKLPSVWWFGAGAKNVWHLWTTAERLFGAAKYSATAKSWLHGRSAERSRSSKRI